MKDNSHYLVEHASDAAFAISGGRKVIAWNQEAERLMGYKHEEAIGQPCSNILNAICPDGNSLCSSDCEAFHNYLLAQPFSMPVCRIRHKNGDWLPVSISSVAMPGDTGSEDEPSAIAIVFLRKVEEKSCRPSPCPALEIITLGRFTLTLNDSDLETDRWKRKQALTLLKLLAVHLDRGIHRDTLIEHLWPDADETQGHERLKATVYFLRKQLRTAGASGTIVERKGKTYMLRREAVWVDVPAFENYVSEGWKEQRENHLDDALDNFRKAQSLYLGDFMEEDIYADWCTEERARLREIFLEALAGIVECHSVKGHFAEAVQVCRIALVQDPCRESFHCALMENLVRLGRADWALAQYRSCERTLERELGVSPMPRTQNLMRQILEDNENNDSTNAPRIADRY